MKVAFQGERGAYSEEAIIKRWGEKADPVPRPYLVDVFDAVKNGEADLGLVPIENSIQGTIVRTFDLLNERDLYTQGETVLRIRHCLIVNPGVTNIDIKKVYSHPQALGQSREYMEKHGYEPVGTYDTAGSVKMIKEKGMMDAAAIASSRAAKVYNMKILENGIETHKKNYTRFVVIGKEKMKPTGKDKTTLAFIVEHRPGTLVSALESIASRDINLMKIESRPLIGNPWEYIFFIEIQGHIQDQNIKDALEELKQHTIYIKHLGSYPRI